MRLATLAIALLAMAILVLIGRSAQTSSKRTVRIAAASDLRFVFDELKTAFEKEHPDIELQPTFGSSGNFFAQLTARAPFDIFLSADVSYPRKLIEQSIGTSGDDFIYATGAIVIWTPKSSSLNFEKHGFDALLDPSVKKIALANPRHAPYGRAGEAALNNAGLYEKIESKLVLGDNVAQTAQFAESGAADVAIVALALANSPHMREKGRFWRVPRELYPPLEQSGLILPWAKDAAAAAAFKSFLLGKGGREIFKRDDFTLPGD